MALWGTRESQWGQTHSGVQLRPLGWEAFTNAKSGCICKTLQPNVLHQGLVTDIHTSAAVFFFLY